MKRPPPPAPPTEPIPYACRTCPMNPLDVLAGALFGSSLTIVALVLFGVIQ